jgi:hypothetical protein
MALHWDISKCKDVEELKGKGEWGITDTIIWMTMPCAIGHIKESNWREFLFRLKVVECIQGPILHQFIPNTDPPEAGKGENKPMYFTPEMIKKRIGLHTNVITETRAAWMRGWVKNAFESIDREINREEQKEEKEVANG